MVFSRAETELMAADTLGSLNEINTALRPASVGISPVVGASRSTLYESDAVTLSGADGAVWPVVARGDGTPELCINASGNWVDSGAVRSGDTIQIRLFSAGSRETEYIARLYFPGMAAAFSVTTS